MTADLEKLVKPLVWEHHPMGFIAAPPTGQAYIIDIRIKDRVMFVKGMNPPPTCSSLEAAKAAAQTDYARRIAAALDPDAVARMVQAEREACAKVLDKAVNFADDGIVRKAGNMTERFIALEISSLLRRIAVAIRARGEA